MCFMIYLDLVQQYILILIYFIYIYTHTHRRVCVCVCVYELKPKLLLMGCVGLSLENNE